MLGETGACGNYAESSVCRWSPSASTTSPGRKRFWRVVLDQDGGVCGGVSSATSEGQPGLSSLRVEKKRFIHLVDYAHLTIFYFIHFSCGGSTESVRYVASVHLTVITIYNHFYVFISGHSCFTVLYHDLASTAGQLDVLRTQHFEYIESASYIYDYYYYCCFMLLPICLSCDWVIG